jgi:amidohydrolase
MAMLLGVARIFIQMKDQLPGSVVFIFQPGEEGAPPGEEDGAVQMIREGALSRDPKPEVIFGVHVVTLFETGQVTYHAGGAEAGSDQVNISVHGRQANAVTPWAGVDAIVVASQVVLGLQTIVSRETELTKTPVVLSVMEIHGGAFLTVPESVQMTVLVQTFDPKTRLDVIARIKRTAENIAASAGATADAAVVPEMYSPAVYNDPKLVARMLPTLRRVAGDRLLEIPPQPFGDDFSFFQEKVPGFLLLIGARKSGDEFIPNHSPKFKLDEASFEIGVRTLANLSVDYMLGGR